MTALQTLTRVFRFGATELPDTDPSLPPAEVLKHYVGAYPFLALADIGEPEIVGDRMVYPVKKREAQTKGAGLRRLTPAQARALDALSDLDDTASDDAEGNAERWIDPHAFVQRLLTRPPTPVADAMMVPML